jgi:hypothetical protein
MEWDVDNKLNASSSMFLTVGQDERVFWSGMDRKASGVQLKDGLRLS